jgi:hypothetical protein
MTDQEAFLVEYRALIRKYGMFVEDNIYGHPVLYAATPEHVEAHLKKLTVEQPAKKPKAAKKRQVTRLEEFGMDDDILY